MDELTASDEYACEATEGADWHRRVKVDRNRRLQATKHSGSDRNREVEVVGDLSLLIGADGYR